MQIYLSVDHAPKLSVTYMVRISLDNLVTFWQLDFFLSRNFLPETAVNLLIYQKENAIHIPSVYVSNIFRLH